VWAWYSLGMTTNNDRVPHDELRRRVNGLAEMMMSVFDTDAYADVLEAVARDEGHDNLDVIMLDADHDAYRADLETRVATALFVQLNALMFRKLD
jgi:predicted O-methyltransferase YrrM